MQIGFVGLGRMGGNMVHRIHRDSDHKVVAFDPSADAVKAAEDQLGPDAQSAAAEGQKIAFDRSKGNCLTCHVIKGGDLPGSIAPELVDIKSKYPNRADLVAILTDETLRNPLTVMPPFGRNRILTEQEINAVVDFLQTL